MEGYIFLEEKWVELPAMNNPHSLMSSVVVDQEVIVSGGNPGDAITNTIARNARNKKLCEIRMVAYE